MFLDIDFKANIYYTMITLQSVVIITLVLLFYTHKRSQINYKHNFNKNFIELTTKAQDLFYS